jgi:mannose-6-phosphate isomerase-like protein (cupin superfamily)
MTTRTGIKKPLSTVPLEDAHGGSGRRQLIFSKTEPFVSTKLEAMTKGFLPSGAAYDWHEHDKVDEFFFIVAGTGFIEYADGTKFDYAEDDFFYNPCNLKHRIVNTGTGDSIFYFIRVAAGEQHEGS